FEEEPRVFTFSMHAEKNYPFTKEKSDLDIGLPDGADDTLYLATLKRILPELLEKVQPDFVFYLSGVDILESDNLGVLACTREAGRLRDKFVVEDLYDTNLPVQISIGGGYSKQLRYIVDAHANTFRTVQDAYF